MKKIKFGILLLLITSSVYSQIKVNSSEKDYLNKSIWSQIFNDFEGIVTIPVITPWIIGVGTYSYIKNDVFTKNILREQDVFSMKDLKFRELTSSINTSFLNFIPVDSTLRMRAIYKDRVLYNYEVSQTDTTFKVDFAIPSKNRGETIVFDKTGRLRTFSSFDTWDSTSVENNQFSDSLSVCSTSYSGSINNLIEKQQFENGYIARKTAVKKNKSSLKESFVSDIIYKYNDESKLICKQNLNKKKKVTDSVIYCYDNQGRITMMLQEGEKIIGEEIIAYDYAKKDTVIKIFNANNDYKYTITYISSANRLSQIIFNETEYPEADAFNFEYNTQGLLMTVSDFSPLNKKNNVAPNKQFIFNYNEYNNIKKVTVINSAGVITKEINFEYDYL